MAPFVIALVVGASLFGTGTVIKPEAPKAGTVLQVAGIGTVLGGAVGSITGLASAIGVTASNAVTGGAIIGGLSLPTGYVLYKKN